MEYKIPEEVHIVIETLEKAGFEGFLVGGCVRDLLLKREPKDWDVATNAKPEEIQNIFPESVYENEFGTVGVKTESETPNLKVIEVTTYRAEGRYTDKRHPDEVRFAKTIEEDLSRRDFTVNALAFSLKPRTSNLEPVLIDPFGGKEDLELKTIRTVRDPHERFNEDALRLMRAVRFAIELEFEIDLDTRRAIEKLAGNLEMIAKERVRDELVKIIMTPRAARGIILLEELDLLRYVIPELREGLGMSQNLHHIYTVFDHNVRSLDYTVKKNYSLEVRLAALLHDVGKPKTKRGEGLHSTFYGHEIVGGKMTARILDRLHFSKEIIEKVAHLVRYHMFYYNVGEVSAAGVRRFLRRVGSEHVDDLIRLREADRIGSGTPKAVPYKLRHFLFMIEKVKHDPLTPSMLAIDGNDLMKLLEIPPGPRVGWVLNALLEDVLDDPDRNTKEYLEEKVKELHAMSDDKLMAIATRAKESKEEVEAEIEGEMKKKFFVQ